jgi:hypothetical protein
VVHQAIYRWRRYTRPNQPALATARDPQPTAAHQNGLISEASDYNHATSRCAGGIRCLATIGVSRPDIRKRGTRYATPRLRGGILATTIMPLHALAGTATRRGASSPDSSTRGITNNHASGIPFTLAVAEPAASPRRIKSGLSPCLTSLTTSHHPLSMSGHFIGQLRRGLPVRTPPLAHILVYILLLAARSGSTDPQPSRYSHQRQNGRIIRNKASRTGGRFGPDLLVAWHWSERTVS